MSQYGGSAGAARVAPDVWPADTTIGRAADRPSLFIFIHPRCPCSRATLAELTSLLTQCEKPIATILVFAKPTGAPPDWTDTTLSRTAKDLGATVIHIDENNSEAQRFGAETSGHAMLYGTTGKLLFSGGITPSRGQIGDNAGCQQILAMVNRAFVPQVKQTPVFGCPLFTPAKCHSGDEACQN